jgi:hypothetical protein
MDETPDKKLTHPAYTAKLLANPRFKLVRGSGQAFVIGGQSPAIPNPTPEPQKPGEDAPEGLGRSPP